MREVLKEVIGNLYELPDLLVSHPIDVAFSLGLITAQLETLQKSLTYGDGEF